eukprot:SAG22_NODE_7428_length_741_cov_0.730530_1_plen_161_part_10
MESSTAPEGELVPTKIFVKNLPWRAEEKDLQEYFAEAGNVTAVRLPTNEDGSKKGFGFVEFESAEGANKAVEWDGGDFQGRPVQISMATEKDGGAAAGGPLRNFETSEKEEGCTTVFLGNLSWTVEEEEVLTLFRQCGTVSQVRFATDRETQEFKGFGYVE